VTEPPLDADRRSDAFFTAEVDRTGRTWGFNYGIRSFGREFETESGFIPRVGIVNASAFNRLTWYGGPGALLESIQTVFNPRYIWQHGALGDGPIEGSESLGVTFRARG